MQVEQIVEEAIEHIEQGSFRHDVLQCAKRFKSNWFELGELLTRVATQKLYEEWGYRTFEDYCRLEIRIRKGTAVKLTNAWFFATQEEPQLAPTSTKQDEEPFIPDLDAVNVLQKAKSNETWTPDLYETLKESVVGKKLTGSTLARKYRELDKLAGNSHDEGHLKRTLQLARRLQKALNEIEEVPKEHQKSLGHLEEWLNQVNEKRLSDEHNSQIFPNENVQR